MSLFIASAVLAQPTVDWVKTFINTGENVGLSGITTTPASDGGMFVTGTRTSPFNNNSIRVISKISSGGVLLWTRVAPQLAFESYGDTAHILAQPDGGVIVPTYDPKATNSLNVLLTKFNAAGDVLWSKSAADSTSNFALVADAGGAFFMLSASVQKFDASGKLLWRVKTSSLPQSARVDVDGSLIVKTANQLLRISANGASVTVLVNRTTYDALPASSGRITVLTPANSNSASVASLKVSSVNASGIEQWSQIVNIPNSINEASNSRLHPASNGGTYLVHKRYYASYVDVALIDANGAIVWNRNYFMLTAAFQGDNGILYGVRYDATASGGINSVFPISATNGELGSPAIVTTNNPVQRLENWSYASGSLSAVATSSTPQRLFSIGTTGAIAWGSELAQLIPENRIDNGSCLMPRLAMSSPSRANSFIQRGNSAQNIIPSVHATDTSGNELSKLDAVSHCSTLLNDDGSTIRATLNNVTRVSTSGVNEWSTATPYTYADNAPKLVLRAANSDVLTAGQGNVSRYTSAGGLVWSTPYFISGTTYHTTDAAFVYEDAAGNVIVAGPSSGSTEPWAIKVSASGALVYRQSLGTSACTDSTGHFSATPEGELLLATTSCNQGRLFKYAADGALSWERTIFGTSEQPYVRLTSLVVAANGDSYVGGCADSSSSTSGGLMTASVLQRFSASGSEGWKRVEDVVPLSKECVSALAIHGNQLLVGIKSDRTTRPSYLLSVATSDGAEAFRSFTALDGPPVFVTDFAVLPNAKVLALGSAYVVSTNRTDASLRSIDVSMNASLRVAFIANPSTVERLKPFNVTVGLKDDLGAPKVATKITRVFVQIDGKPSSDANYCDVPIGQSSCVVSGIRMTQAGSGQYLFAETEGAPPAKSGAIAVTPAATTTTISVLTPGPYKAYDVIRVRVDVQGEREVGVDDTSTLSVGFVGSGCTSQTNLDGLWIRAECDTTVRVGSTLSATFTGSSGYLSSSATLALEATPIPVTISATAFPSPNIVVGTTFDVYVRLFDANGINISQRVGGTLNLMEGATTLCPMSVIGDRYVCSVTTSITGVRNFTVSTPVGNANMTSSQTASLTVNVIGGLLLQGAMLNTPLASVSFCASSSTGSNAASNAVDCEFDPQASRYVCVIPNGWSGTITPQATSLDTTFNPQTVRINGEAGAMLRNFAANTSARMCNVDTDGNGIVDPMIDGQFILRAMVAGSTATTVESMPMDVCARRTTAERASLVSAQIANLAYDFDGDGLVKPETDGLILLRAMLGFIGDAVTQGAVGANAVRSNWPSILSYMQNSCRMLP